MKRWVILTLLLALKPGLGRADQMGTITRSCFMYLEPKKQSMTLCRVRESNTVTVFEVLETGYAIAKFGECEGFLPMRCVKLSPKASMTEPERKSKRTPAQDPGSVSIYNSHFRLGFEISGDGLIASVPYSTTSSFGLGYAVGLTARFPLAPGFHLTITPRYQRINLSRTVDGSGALTDPSPVVYSQSVGYGGAGVLIGHRFKGGWDALSDTGPLEFWMDGGAEMLFPLSGTQETSVGSTTSYTPDDKILYVVTGSSLTYISRDSFGLTIGLHVLYNLASSGGSRVLGARLGVAVTMGL